MRCRLPRLGPIPFFAKKTATFPHYPPSQGACLWRRNLDWTTCGDSEQLSRLISVQDESLPTDMVCCCINDPWIPAPLVCGSVGCLNSKLFNPCRCDLGEKKRKPTPPKSNTILIRNLKNGIWKRILIMAMFWFHVKFGGCSSQSRCTGFLAALLWKKALGELMGSDGDSLRVCQHGLLDPSGGNGKWTTYKMMVPLNL